jgi:hypothetical protein
VVRNRKPEVSPSDLNRHRRLQMIREIDRLLEKLTESGTSAHAIVEISSKNGRLGQVKSTMSRFLPDED